MLRVYVRSFEETHANAPNVSLADDAVCLFAKEIFSGYLSVCNTQFKRQIKDFVGFFLCLFFLRLSRVSLKRSD